MSHHPALTAQFAAPSCRLCAVLVLCLCVILQLLGTPATLLNPGSLSDPVGASILEGFSVPPAPIGLILSPEASPVSETLSVLYSPILASALFHPPLF